MAIAKTAPLLAALVAAGCAAAQGGPAGSGTFSGSVDDRDAASLALAAERSAVALEAGGQRSFELGGRSFSSAELAASARRVAEVARNESDPARLTRTLARDCRTFGYDVPAKVTAYYEPVLSARRSADPRFRYPIYRMPTAEQLAAVTKKLGRVPARADIDGKLALAGLGLELAFVEDPVARFFLHVQGSGRLVFEDGTELRVGFAGTNGLAYRSIGALMLADGSLEPGHATAPAIRAWLASHSDERDALLERNPRYVFFRETGGEGPIGALGTTLVAGRSIATDERYVPRGVLAWLRTTRPLVDASGAITGRAPLTRFVFAQDAGAAIEGPTRVDLFVGAGEEAGIEAGSMNESGELFLLVCRDARASSARQVTRPW